MSPAESGLTCAALVGHQSEESTRTVAGLPATFVGRTDELETLRNSYDHVVRLRRPRLVSVVGEPGIGKSTLVTRFVEELHHTDHALTAYVGRCPPYGRGASYAALTDVLREHLKIPTDAGLDEIRRRLHSSPTPGLTFGLDAAEQDDPKAARAKLYHAWAELVTDMCAKVPTVIVVEDLHWAQPRCSTRSLIS
jgi:predicted ATPase